MNIEDVKVEALTKQLSGFAPMMYSGVRLTHVPSGISVTVDSERSQHKNRNLAWERLSALVAPTERKGEPGLFATEAQPRPLRYSLDDYHRAPSEGPLHATWQDKPRRLLYDLVAALAYYTSPQVPEDLPWSGLDLNAMAEAFHRVIEADAARTPFVSPATRQAQLALREFRLCIPAMVAMLDAAKKDPS